jgi:hypothetical protein
MASRVMGEPIPAFSRELAGIVLGVGDQLLTWHCERRAGEQLIGWSRWRWHEVLDHIERQVFATTSAAPWRCREGVRSSGAALAT